MNRKLNAAITAGLSLSMVLSSTPVAAIAAETAQAMDRIYYTLLASPPDTGRLQALHALDTGADRVQVVGQALYTLYATRHSDSRLNNNFYERQLRLAATTRNFNTLTRLIELSA